VERTYIKGKMAVGRPVLSEAIISMVKLSKTISTDEHIRKLKIINIKKELKYVMLHKPEGVVHCP